MDSQRAHPLQQSTTLKRRIPPFAMGKNESMGIEEGQTAFGRRGMEPPYGRLSLRDTSALETVTLLPVLPRQLKCLYAE